MWTIKEFLGLSLGMAIVFCMASTYEQEKGDKPEQTAEKVVKAKVVGGDVKVYLPKGLEYQLLSSNVLKDKAKPEALKDGGLLIRGRSPVFVHEPGDKLTFKLVGTFTKEVRIGLPAGYSGTFE